MMTAKSLSQSQTRPVPAFGWTVPELFGLHPVPEQSASNYARLARLDDMGLLWLLWLHRRDVLVVKSDHQEPLVVVRLSLAAEIAKRTA
jgi:hypothetical protein